jgi:UDP-glucose 4-epimerase
VARYLVTGGAGFIGSNLVHALAVQGHRVRVLDDFSAGRRNNLDGIVDAIEVIEGSITNRDIVFDSMTDVDSCFHQGAVVSVPQSIEQPGITCDANITGTVNVFEAARDRKIRRVVFASSSAVYGDVEEMPVKETLPLAPISPYGITKAADEMYARVFNELFDMDIVGLRYFNVFGPRQDPNSPYAAVVPIFIRHMLAGEAPTVHGDGRQSRDFTYVSNVVDANLRACNAEGRVGGVYNVACGTANSILELVQHLNDIFGTQIEPTFEPARAGDIRLSWATIDAARDVFGFRPAVSVQEGLRRTVDWYRAQREAERGQPGIT